MSDQTFPHSSGIYDLAEASRLSGLSVEALRKRISRGKLEQVKGNDGSIRVRLTTADLETLGRTPAGQTSGQNVLEVQTVPDTASLERAARAEGEVVRLVEDRDRALRQVGDLERRIEEFRQEASNLTGELTAARIRTAALEAEAAGLRTALEKAERPFWRKLIGR